MSAPKTISTRPLPEAQDFDALRRQGIEYIQQLGGTIWTDYNVHDPGITLLEQICYALTDLGYRAGFEMQDLLASAANELFSPRQILHADAVTLIDYRKLAIDVEGVNNAWIVPLRGAYGNFYYYPNQQRISTRIEENNERGEELKLKGLYQVILETTPYEGLSDGEIVETVRRRLLTHRNLCEDFVSVRSLPPELIGIKTAIEIREGYEAEKVLAQIQDAIMHFLRPAPRFYTLQQMQARGLPQDEIFSGPALDHGFLVDEEVRQLQRRDSLHTSDLIGVIMEIEGVLTIRSLSIASGNNRSEWYLDLDPQKAPLLDQLKSEISLFRNELPVIVNPERVEKRLSVLRQLRQKRSLEAPAKDILPLQGRYRGLERYHSLQTHLPALFGVGELGLPRNASPQRQAQARQLQAYLMLFDQILANEFQQLAEAKSLFSPLDLNLHSYFAQALRSPGANDLLSFQAQDPDSLQAMVEDESSAVERINRLLDHLLARFGEQVPEFAGQRAVAGEAKLVKNDRQLIEAKQAFYRNYQGMSQRRSQGLNYRLAAWENDNVSGLKMRISFLLGITDYRNRPLSQLDALDNGGFYMMEHILLRPVEGDQHQNGLLLTHMPEPDPYSLKLSFIFPAWLKRFEEGSEFREYVLHTVRAATPAHLRIEFHWLTQPQMQNYEVAYQEWLKLLAQ